MVLSITLIAVALTLIGRVTLQLARLERTMNEERLTDEAWRRLARDFRADAHAAQSALAIVDEDDQDDAAVRFIRDDDATAEYRVATEGIVRVVRQGDRVMHRERYRLGQRNWTSIILKKPAAVTAALNQAGNWAEITGGDETDRGERRVRWRILAAITSEVARSSPRRSRRRRSQRQQSQRQQSQRRRSPRRGAILAAALVALLIITMFSAILIRRTYLARTQTRLANQRLQASWVVESMVRRAVLRAETRPMAESLRLIIPTSPAGAALENITLHHENAASEKVTSEKVTSEKVTSEKVTSEKVTSEKVTSEKVTSEKVTSEKASGEKASGEKAAGDEGRGQRVREQEVWRVTIEWTEMQGESSTWNLQVTATLGEETRPIVVERRERRVKLGRNLPQSKEGSDES
jgi:hypothetical protein